MIYMLHPCASISASWLKDNHIEPQRQEAYNLLSTAAQLMAVEESLVLLAPKKVEAESLEWVMESCWHYCWLLQYWNILCISTERVQWKESKEFASYCEIFPDNPFRELDHARMRQEYSKTKGVYRRNRPPFWFRKPIDLGYLADAVNEFDPELF